MEFFREWGIVLNQFTHSMELVIAGLIGGGISSRLARKPDDPPSGKWDALFFISTGGVCAYFLTGWAMRIFNIEDSNMGAVSFLLGIFGASIITLLLNVLRNIKAVDILDLFKSFVGRGK